MVVERGGVTFVLVVEVIEIGGWMFWFIFDHEFVGWVGQWVVGIL